MKNVLKPRGYFTIQHIRDGEILSEQRFQNGITDEGKDELLKIAFSVEEAPVTWYIGMLLGTTLNAADVMGSHAGWVLIDDVDEATRPAWISGDNVTSQSLTNAAAVVYTVDNVAGHTIDGVFIVSSDDLDGETGILWSTGLFGTQINAADNDVINITYTLSVD